MTHLDFRRDRRGGTSVNVRESDAVGVSLGVWTSVRTMGVTMDFDNDALQWTSLSIIPLSDEELVAQALTAAARLTTPNVMRQLFSALRTAYLTGVRDGEQHKLEQVREVLGL